MRYAWRFGKRHYLLNLLNLLNPLTPLNSFLNQPDDVFR